MGPKDLEKVVEEVKQDKVIEISFNTLERDGYPSVTDFCRYLVSTGGKFEGVKVHVFRGDMLCLIVNDIYEAAKIEPTGTGFRMARPKRLKRSSKPVLASAVSLNE